ncbi:HlyD family efflux transporter periplasmic adaptor subunit [Calothrix sp. FACHB-1219]|uniref:HlyD family efflux transporter periplasmic adaptor subunit n=1 Tax=unclassified Calothrix TaxID=2619626 RepID=UPI001688672F|nr:MULTISPECIES: HlyD family efflux transporter periplasmic adaptor subunit [unclassified Calothrix]MBD2202457.1 HlyD family efflux transporter periplasmic adaptor subunit [Calothrix sp. FACHB-168]MBD2217952.1 HlyD family efflux transporter periplasmic adaptor subunit [Calothrix sp. FACHB-1219]
MTQLNDNSFNDTNSNGKQRTPTQSDSQQVVTTSVESVDVQPVKEPQFNFREPNFEQAVILRQSPIWSRTIMVSLMLIACFGLAWAYLAKIEQVVPATGQLKPEGTVKDVQAPVNGVVKEVFVKDGQQVQAGDLLLTFDSIASRAELNSLNQIRAAITQENQIYRRLMGVSSATASELEFLRSRLPQDTAFLLKSRRELVSENDLLRNQLNKSGTDAGLGSDEQRRLAVARRELDSRSLAAQLEVEKTRKQLAQTQVKKEDTQKSLEIQSTILGRVKILAEEGGISQLQYLNQQQQVQNLRAEIAQLAEEEKRLQFEIQKGQQQSVNTVAASDKDILERISQNKQRIADIDSQFSKILLENEQRLSDINSKIAQARQNIKYQELRAPVSGTIFDLQAKTAGYVANPTQKLMQIVPNDKFIAEVFITNRDIGFVREDMKVDVRIDSFPFSEFGDIKGKVIGIGSDALPPDQTHQFYRFPARVSLEKQYLTVRDKKINLQSGMSLTANIKVREERSVLSLFTELFTKQVESLKEVR